MSQHNITRLGHQGDGIAEGPIYAPRTLPGEEVTGTLDGSILKDIRIVTPSEHRVAPLCAHAKSCGGCQLQHAAAPFVATWKEDMVRKALAAHDLDPPFLPLHTSPAQSRRRATFSLRRTKKGAIWGFHGQASGTVIAVPKCQLVLPELRGIDPLMQALAEAGGSRKGEMSVTVTASLNGLDVAVSGGKPMDDALLFALSGLTEAHQLARLTWEGEVIGLRLPPSQDFDGIKVTPPPGAFLQATKEGEEALRSAVQAMVQGGAKGIDLFAGSGTFTLPLAKQAQMHGIEGDAAMTEALQKAWRNGSGLKQVTSETRDLFRSPVHHTDLNTYDFAVLDPPRAGAEAQIAQLSLSKIPRIAYVSCNPVTFARDAAQLTTSGFTLDHVQVVDQFRWSAHVELAAQLSRPHMGD